MKVLSERRRPWRSIAAFEPARVGDVTPHIYFVDTVPEAKWQKKLSLQPYKMSWTKGP